MYQVENMTCWKTTEQQLMVGLSNHPQPLETFQANSRIQEKANQVYSLEILQIYLIYHVKNAYYSLVGPISEEIVS